MREGEFKMTDDLDGFEARLASLVPTSVDGVRDRVMFEAGRRSVVHKVRVWRGVTAVVAASLALVLIVPHLSGLAHLGHDDTNTSAAHLTVSPELASARLVAPIGESGYLNVRRRVLDQGLKALPSADCARPTSARPGGAMRFDWEDAS